MTPIPVRASILVFLHGGGMQESLSSLTAASFVSER